MGKRGRVVSLTAQQRVNRALYLAGELQGSELDPHIVEPPTYCTLGYYRLHDHNGGTDPTAVDPFARWKDPGSDHPDFVRITADCVGGAAWCSGFDRFQPVRFQHIYKGWINTDSMILDARGPARCFTALRRPEPGCLIVCKSGSPGHEIGHVGIVVDVPAEWDPTYRESWEAIGVVDVAARQGRANKRTTGLGWRGTAAMFLVPIMAP